MSSMKRDISPDEVLNSLLSDWHHWQSARPVNGCDRLAGGEPGSRDGWDSADEETDKALHASTMQTIDFHVSGDSSGHGGLKEPHQSAIYCLARNCYAGSNVWSSPRLPRDALERVVITQEARNMLMRKLISAGVM